jgi:hypothetical protein
LKDGKSKIEVDFDAAYSEESEQVIKKNIDFMENVILK